VENSDSELITHAKKNADRNCGFALIQFSGNKPAGGNLGENWIEGPGSFHFDLSASKTVRVDETKSVQFRVDARNVLNHPILWESEFEHQFVGFRPHPGRPGHWGAPVSDPTASQLLGCSET
jgi:hypothetical protein